MAIPKLPTGTREGRELIETWRLELAEALGRYRAATKEYRELLRKKHDGLTPQPNGDLARSRHAESEALLEYRRVLGIFTYVTAHGKLPETPPESSEGQSID